MRAALQRRTWSSVGGKADLSQQCAAQKAASSPGCISRGVAAGREGTVPLCSALVRPHLESCVQAWGPQHRKDVGLLERVQRRPRGHSEAAAPLLQRQTEELGVFSLEKRRLQGDLPEVEGSL